MRLSRYQAESLGPIKEKGFIVYDAKLATYRYMHASKRGCVGSKSEEKAVMDAIKGGLLEEDYQRRQFSMNFYRLTQAGLEALEEYRNG